MKGLSFFLLAPLNLLFVLFSLSPFLLFCFPSAVHAQWEPDVRLTYDSCASWTPFNNARCIVADSGTLHVVWRDKRDGPNGEIYYKRSTDEGVSWAPDVRLTYDSAWSAFPSISSSGPFVHLVWNDDRDGNDEVYYRRSTDRGATWSQELCLSQDPATSDFPSLWAVGSNVHAAWTDTRDGNYEIYYKRSTDNGETWSQDIRLTNDTAGSASPSVFCSGELVETVWGETRDGNNEVYFKRSTDQGVSWLPDVRLTYAPDFSYHPSIYISGLDVHVVWHDRRDGHPEIYYKQSTDGGTTWSPDVRLTQNSAFKDWPSIAASGSNVHIVWEEDNGAFYKRSTDKGVTWSQDTLLPNTSASFRPFLALSGGMVHVVWIDDRDGNSEIYYKRNPPGNIGVGESSGSFYPLTSNLSISVVPNPFTSFASVPGHEGERFTLYDISGRLVGRYKGDRVGEGLAAGVYFLKPEGKDAKPLRVIKLR